MQKTEPTGALTSHPEFGELVTVRKVTWVDRLVCGVLVVAALFFAWVASIAIHGWLTNPNPHTVSSKNEWIGVLVMVAIAVGVCILTWKYLERCRTQYEFYASGVTMKRGGTIVNSLPYAAVEKFKFFVVRQYVNGIYTGTTLNVRMIAADKRKIVFSGSHKERAKGLGHTIFVKRFEGTDEMDIVRILIAEQMLPALSKRLAEVGSVEWCGKVQLSATGVTPVRGKYKRTEVPYTAISGAMFKDGAYHAFRKGDERSFLDLAMGEENFWPGLLLFESLVSQYQPEAGQEDGAKAQAT